MQVQPMQEAGHGSENDYRKYRKYRKLPLSAVACCAKEQHALSFRDAKSRFSATSQNC
jgi:hypothetical protein